MFLPEIFLPMSGGFWYIIRTARDGPTSARAKEVTPMLQLVHGTGGRNCAGITRRTALKAGFLGLLGLSQADLLRLRAESPDAANDKAVILLWLDGGPSQLET